MKTVFVYMLYVFLWFINFYDVCSTKIKHFVDGFVNKRLEGRVLYYALYSKSDNYYALLYDYTSTWNKLKLVIMHIYDKSYLETHNIFNFDDVSENIAHLSNYSIDCAVVTYMENTQENHRLMTSSNVIEDINVSFVYAMVYENDTVDSPLYDMTKDFNTYKNDIFQIKTLNIENFVTILMIKKQMNLPNFTDLTLKCMMDDSLNELVFKAKDNINVI